MGQAENLACRKRQPGAFAGVARTHSPGRGRRPQEDPCHGRVSPVCRFRSEDGAVPMSRVLGRRWAVCGAAAVWDSHDEMILAIQSIQFQKKNASGSPVWGPLEAFDFRTRIKDRGGEPPPVRSQRPAVRGVSRGCGFHPRKNLGGRYGQVPEF